jgi:hypothetical protein
MPKGGRPFGAGVALAFEELANGYFAFISFLSSSTISCAN